MKWLTVLIAGIMLYGCSGAKEAAWPFADSRGTIVTTQWVVANNRKPILTVMRDSIDGFWMFFAEGRPTIDPVVRVTLGDMVQQDSTLLLLSELKLGWKASRTSPGKPWIFRLQEEEEGPKPSHQVNKESLTPADLPLQCFQDLKILEEVYRLLDLYANEAWSGWDNYERIPIEFRYPNGLQMSVGKPWKMGDYRFVTDIHVRGAGIFLDQSAVTSGTPLGTLDFIGGGASMGRGDPRVTIRRVRLTPERIEKSEKLLAELDPGRKWPAALPYSIDNTIFALIHELFHCYSDYAPLFRTDMTLYDSDANYAVWAQTEEESLEKAATEKHPSVREALLKKAAIARDQKEQGMSEVQRAYAAGREKSEGLAEYATLKMVLLIDTKYSPSEDLKGDSLFFGFRYKDYFKPFRIDSYHRVRQASLESSAMAYGTGYFQAKVLDEVRPGWRKTVYSDSLMLDDLLYGNLAFQDGERQNLLKAMKTDPGFSATLAFHSQAFQTRDSVIALLDDPNLNAIEIQLGLRSMLPDFEYEGKRFRFGLKQYFFDGRFSISSDKLSMTVKELPVVYDLIGRKITFVLHGDGQAMPQVDLGYVSVGGGDTYEKPVLTGEGFKVESSKAGIQTTGHRIHVSIAD